MTTPKKWEVASDTDNSVAFTAESVTRQAKMWRVGEKVAANRIARENGDTVMGEILFVREVEG